MAPSRDPFGFSTQKPGPSTNPLVVVAQPGQELRIIVSDDPVSAQEFGDSRASRQGSGDSRASRQGSGDSRASRQGSGDLEGHDPFGFNRIRPGFSPSPVTIVARSGQEIRIVVPDQAGRVAGFSGDSRASRQGSGDQS